MAAIGRAHHRADDGEVVGYLADAADGMVQPLDLLGHELGPPTSEEAAARRVEGAGLEAIDGAWWALAPTPLAPDTDLARPQSGWSWRTLVVVEVTAERAMLRLRYPAADELSTVALALPARGVLRRDPPG